MLKTAMILGCAFALASGATQAATAEAQARRSAYDSAMKCFVANGHARGMRTRAGDPAKASYYEGKARLSFDTAVKLGGVLGFSGTHIDQDFGLIQTQELPAMVKDQAYFLQVASTCKALGLM